MEREIFKKSQSGGWNKNRSRKEFRKRKEKGNEKKKQGGRGEIFIHILNLHSFYMWIVNFTHGSKKSQSGSKFQKNCDPDPPFRKITLRIRRPKKFKIPIRNNGHY